MQLLDASMAFALTLAALGTAVTVIMEAIHRVFRIRKGNLILVLQHLNKEIPKGLFRDIKPPRRWDFIASVLNNKTRVKDKLPDSSMVGAPSGEKSIPIVFWARHTMKGPATSDNSLEKAWDDVIDSLGRRNGTRGIYDKVSLEHVLRKFVEIDEVREKIAESRKAAKVEINRLTRKYEEFATAVAADFKRRAQLWSVVIGILLALVANINGLRIFEAYMVNDDLTDRVIGQLETIGEEANEAQVSFQKDAVQKLASLGESGVPIGMKYFPHCVFYKWLSGGKGVSCLEREPKSTSYNLEWFIAWISWLIVTVLTGMLIGLGAPFWFDVAKRLAAVRGMFGGTKSTEERLRGKDAEGDPKKRKELIENIIEDTMSERGVTLSGSPSHRKLLNPAPKQGPSYKGGKR